MGRHRMTGTKVEMHALVRGRVQGVFYRQFTLEQAQTLGLRGWVRNHEDGATVEVMGQGPRPALEKLLTALREGPADATVTGVEVDWRPPGAAFLRFTVRG